VSAVLADPQIATRVVPLADAVEFNPKPRRGSIPEDLQVSFLPMAAVEAGSGRMESTYGRPYGEVKKGFTYFCDGDVLFAKITPCMENGKMTVAHGLRNGIGFGSTEFHVLRPRDGVDSRYVYHFVSSAGFRREAAHHMTGAVGQKRVPLAFLQQSALPLPPINEQRRIVAEIENQFSRLDEAIANLQRAKANLKRFRTAILKDAVEGKLVANEVQLSKSHGTAVADGNDLLKILLRERRARWNGRGSYREPEHASEAIGFELPPGWAVATVAQLSWSVEYGSSAKTTEDASGVPVLRMGNVADGQLLFDDLKYLPAEHDDFPKLFLGEGDILFNRTNSPELVGKTAVFKGATRSCSFASYLIRVRTLSGCQPEFLAAYINSTHGRQWVKSVVTQQVGQANVNGSKLQALAVPLPPLAEQHRIVAELDRRLSVVREVDADVDANLRRAHALRATILSRAFGFRSGLAAPRSAHALASS
jgi:type I restriction enzyme S subunit